MSNDFNHSSNCDSNNPPPSSSHSPLPSHLLLFLPPLLLRNTDVLQNTNCVFPLSLFGQLVMLQARGEWETGGFFLLLLRLLLFSFRRTAAKERKSNNNVVKLLHRLKSEMTIGGRNRGCDTTKRIHTQTHTHTVDK